MPFAYAPCMELVPCVQCQRHVDVVGRACPFCAAPVVRPLPRPPRVVKTLTRAAIFYLGASVAAACGTDGAIELPEPDPLEREAVATPDPAPPDPLVEDPALVEHPAGEVAGTEEETETAEATEVEATSPQDVVRPGRRSRRRGRERRLGGVPLEVEPERVVPDHIIDHRLQMPYGAPPLLDEELV